MISEICFSKDTKCQNGSILNLNSLDDETFMKRLQLAASTKWKFFNQSRNSQFRANSASLIAKMLAL